MRRWLPSLLAVLVTVPSLGVGFVLDDWAQRGLVRGDFTHSSRWALFNFGAGDAQALAPSIFDGPYPWFTLPELKLRFLRPLSSALIVFDTEVFGDVAWAQHLHSTLWYLALTAVAYALYRRLTPGVALAAALLFVIDDSHAMTTAWLANRNAWRGVSEGGSPGPRCRRSSTCWACRLERPASPRWPTCWRTS